MEKKETEERYALDLDWYEARGRSFAIIVWSRMCEQHRFDLEKGEGNMPMASDAETLLATIRDCCSQKAEYITPYTPLAEAIFRLFLTNANQPLTIAEVQSGLEERMGYSIVAARATPEAIQRLLERGRHYPYRHIPPAEGLVLSEAEGGDGPKASPEEDPGQQGSPAAIPPPG